MGGGFELAPADGGARVALAAGETVIGRGPLLGIADRKVSRRHAILEVVGDQLRIKPTHSNPCFHQASEESQLLPLETNEWHWLNHGDSFSLLIDKYVFRVLSTHSQMECTLRNSPILDEDDLLNDAPESPLNNLPISLSSGPRVESSLSCSKNTAKRAHAGLQGTEETASNSLSLVGISSVEPNPIQRKRILPAWMLQEDLNAPSPSTTPTNASTGVTKGKGKGRSVPVSQQPGRKRLPLSDLEDAQENESDQGKKLRVVEQELEGSLSSEEVVRPVSGTAHKAKVNTAEAESPRSESPLARLDWEPNGDDAEHTLDSKGKHCTEASKMDRSDPRGHSGNPECHENKSSPSHASQIETQDLDPELINPDPEASSSAPNRTVPQSVQEKKHCRIPCMYGKTCYRKNPVHFRQFSHPGDSDYEDADEASQDDGDERPECPYGASCYRKNPQHKLEYKHPESPETKAKRSRRAATKTGKSELDEDSDNGGEPNEYDLNDSFIDDEEEDEYEPTDEDSDWEPETQGKESEDVEGLLKEAKKFMKRKK
ncbi:aprataxin and PNK-like factor isoform X1 [Ornithorhynchus anatinus]|uniref:Aprataxin and PNK-like factor n=1 Tax=Ornithorhynchus anatinus TaxID=9258 RepID=F6XLV7_ORNAN|nr:aprataxin and PNK-like factor isoform X1 [Ornithorhynchus anatinus]